MKRKFLKKFNVGSQSRSRVHTLQEVMTQHTVFSNTSGERRLKGIDIINTLTGEGAFPEQILINVGKSKCVRVNTGWS